MKESLGADTIICPTPVFVVGSYDEKGRGNLCTVAWGGICCSRPPCVAISLRAATYSHGAIMDRKAFTVNVTPERLAAEADFVGTVSGRDTDKFRHLGLTPVRSELVDAPYVEEFPLVLECKVTRVHELGLHTQFVGEILDVKADDGIMGGDVIDVSKLRPIFYAPGNSAYYGTGAYIGKGYSLGRDLVDRGGG